MEEWSTWSNCTKSCDGGMTEIYSKYLLSVMKQLLKIKYSDKRNENSQLSIDNNYVEQNHVFENFYLDFYKKCKDLLVFEL